MPAPIGNKYAIGNNGGRPPKYTSAKKLIEACDNYFEYIKGEPDTASVTADGEITPPEQKWLRYPEPATITGLSLFLGFDSRSTLNEYAKKEEFSYIIKRAMQRVELRYEQNLSGTTPSGSIFALKNMGWADRTETQTQMLDKEGKPTDPAPVIISTIFPGIEKKL